MRPCGNQAWVDSGFLSKRKMLPLSRLEKMLSDGMLAEGAFMGQLMALAMQAVGIGTFGKFPATVDPIQLTLMIQAHHLDLDFYDTHMKPGAYLPTHQHHFRDWHGGVGPERGIEGAGRVHPGHTGASRTPS